MCGIASLQLLLCMMSSVNFRVILSERESEIPTKMAIMLFDVIFGNNFSTFGIFTRDEPGVVVVQIIGRAADAHYCGFHGCINHSYLAILKALSLQHFYSHSQTHA